MVAHEIAGVLIATIVAVAFVSAIQPGSQMGTLLTNSLQGWTGVLGAISGRGAGQTAQVA